MPTSPSRPEPKSQADAGMGTAPYETESISKLELSPVGVKDNLLNVTAVSITPQKATPPVSVPVYVKPPIDTSSMATLIKVFKYASSRMSKPNAFLH
jgi:hypothetical protein